VINHENRQCGWRSCKTAMVDGGVIKSEFCRHPIEPLHPEIRDRLLSLLRPLNPIVLNWGK
jgi:2-keto-3-deoxy-L-arabinonate dehydratase